MKCHCLFRTAVLAGGSICCVLASQVAFGADIPDTSPPNGVYGILNPTPDSALRTFSPDRPARAISPVTVDAGRFQIESDFLNYSFANQQGATTRTYQAADPVLKLGITDNIDFEVAFGGFVDTRTSGNMTGETLSKGRGFGDVTLTTKFNVIGNQGGKVAFALAPYLIIPGGTHNVTAGQVEGGLIAVDATGEISMPFTSEGMKRAALRPDGRIEAAAF